MEKYIKLKMEYVGNENKIWGNHPPLPLVIVVLSFSLTKDTNTHLSRNSKDYRVRFFLVTIPLCFLNSPFSL